MSVLDAIGNTPLVEIINLWNSKKTGVRIMAKLEGSNPGGSVKDRPAYYMLKEAVASGKLVPGKTILEPTSGNTGIGILISRRNYNYAMPGSWISKALRISRCALVTSVRI